MNETDVLRTASRAYGRLQNALREKSDPNGSLQQAAERLVSENPAAVIEFLVASPIVGTALARFRAHHQL